MIPLLSLLLVLPMAAQGRVVKLDGSSVTGNITAATIEKIEVQSGSETIAVVPGDVLRLHVSKERSKGRVWKFQGHVYVDEILCSEASFMAMLADE